MTRTRDLTLIVCFIASMLISNIKAQHLNIQIGGNLNQYEPNEPSVAINQLDQNIMVAGTNLANVYLSTDAGLNWTHSVLTSIYGVHGDPCIVTDNSGRFYYFHLAHNTTGPTGADRIVCQRLDNPGSSWSPGTYTGLNGTKLQDKEWAAVNQTNDRIVVTWTQFDVYGSSNPDHYSNIYFSRSDDAGETWSNAIRINEVSGDCLDDDNTVEGAVPTFGPDGEIYVAWAGPVGLVFDRSMDYGNTWLQEDIFVSDIPGGWGFHVPGITTNWCNGLPVTACDVSPGPYRGRIYINWSDQRNGLQDTDVWMVFSSDSGDTWSSPVRVNTDPPGSHQFFTWMTVDQSNGTIYVVFYDRRASNDNRTDVYLAVSRDGGVTFTNHKISESPFIPNESVFFGDYTNIAAVNGVVRPVWARLDNTTYSIWTALIDTSLLTGISDKVSNNPESFKLISIYPNPFNPSTTVKYQIPKLSLVTIVVYDVLGNALATLVNEEKPSGIYEVIWSAEDFPSGIYFCKLKSAEYVETKKMIILK